MYLFRTGHTGFNHRCCLLGYRFVFVLIAGLIAAGSGTKGQPIGPSTTAGSPASLPSAGSRPNVLLIMADDLGFADLGSYGGEIDTPHLDRLAAEGVRFTHFRVAPMCTVSRVALLSGLPFNGGSTGAYRHAVPFPQLLREAGYATMMTGKWHAGSPNPRQPPVFDRFFGFMGGMTDSFVGGPGWFDGPRPFTEFPPDFYATDAFANRAIEYIDEATTLGSPWFMFVSFNAPHHPCQAPQATVEKYEQRYLAGYQKIYAQRLAKQRALGLIPADMALHPPGAEVRRWEDLPESRQKIEAQRMAAYAAAVDEIDQNVGRMLAHLDQRGLAENTIVCFISDNGGDYNNGNRLTDAQQIPWHPGANPTPNNGWSWVKNAPFRSFKHSSFEGALASPLILRWPDGLQLEAGSLVHTPAHITDFYPTLLELAGRDYPDQHQGKDLLPLAGTSWLPLMDDQLDLHRPRPDFSWYETSRAWTQEEWKAVQLYDGPWQLFNLNVDRGETQDLAATHPERLRTMVQQWQQQAEIEGVTPQTPATSFPPASAEQPGWGWHRLQMVTGDQLAATIPANGQVDAPATTTLELTFEAPLSFAHSNGRGIRLFAVADESAPVWQARPTSDHPAQGQRRIVFDDLPTLDPDAAYFVEWDPGWVQVGGQPVGPLNDGAYWWCFRTAPKP